MKASSFALQFADLRDRKDALILAEYCLTSILTNDNNLDTAKKSAVTLWISQDSSVRKAVASLNTRGGLKTMFQECLAEFGIQLVDATSNRNGTPYISLLLV